MQAAEPVVEEGREALAGRTVRGAWVRGVGAWSAVVLVALLGCGDSGDSGDDGGKTAGDGGSTAADNTAPGDALDLAGANVLLISLDTCRNDVLGFNGGADGISDAFDAFAAESVVFTHARAQAPQTAPSHMSLFTSSWPGVHGVQNVQHGQDPDTGNKVPLIAAAPLALPTLAEVFAANGYRTVGLTDGGNINPAHGFKRGFEVYTHDLSGAVDQLADAERWLDRLAAADDPWFLFVHTYEVHGPYVSPAEYMQRWAPASYDGPLLQVVSQLEGLDFKQRFAAMKSTFWADKDRFGEAEAEYLFGLYEAGVDFADDTFGRFFDGLRERGVYDDTIVVLLSDHGEEFAEHGQWQHDQLYEECLRVPLVVRLPGARGAGRRVDVPVGLVDVMPTLLDLTELPSDEVVVDGVTRRLLMAGESLGPTLRGGKDPTPRPIYSEYRADRRIHGVHSPLYDWQIAVHANGVKLIYDEHRSNAERGIETYELFALGDDPGEQRDVSADPAHAQVLTRLLEERARYLRGMELFADLERMESSGDLTPEMMRQLAELGYFGDEGQ